jgi:hypothetical protein
MNRRCFLMCTLAPKLLGQGRVLQPDLAKLAGAKDFRLFGCTASPVPDGEKNGIRLSSGCVAYLESTDFANGAIELDLRGKDVQQQSFLGVAFHGVDGTTYDSIYFRPFNFRSEDPARRVRAVQYVSHPDYPWNMLREAHPGKYEQGVAPVPDPNGWFHARIVVASPTVTVFVNDAKRPCLVVTQLSERGKGLVGLWGGGDFANLKLLPA